MERRVIERFVVAIPVAVVVEVAMDVVFAAITKHRLMGEEDVFPIEADMEVVTDEVPAVREIPRVSLVVMVATNKNPACILRLQFEEPFMPLGIIANAKIPQVNEEVMFRHDADFVEDVLAKEAWSSCQLDELVVAEVGVCD